MGNYVATGGGDSLIKIWDLNKAATESLTLKAFNRPISSLAFAYDSDCILACGTDKIIKLCKFRA